MELHRRPPRIYSTFSYLGIDPSTFVDPQGAFPAAGLRQIKLPLSGFRQAKVQITVVPIDPSGFVRVGPGNEDLTQHAHSNVNWALGQAEASPVDVLLDGGDRFAVYTNARCHLLVDWLGWLV